MKKIHLSDEIIGRGSVSCSAIAEAKAFLLPTRILLRAAVAEEERVPTSAIVEAEVFRLPV